MKQPKKLTREQKEIVSAHGLVANNWMFVEDVTESHIKVINKNLKTKKYLDKFIDKKVGNRCILREELISV